jgi:tRNA pseudouridine55 synthase
MTESITDTMTIQDESSDGILSIDKPVGMTSFGVVHRIKKWTHAKKVGHAGTLDPMASGVLLICLDRATKRVPKLMAFEKTYIGTIELGTSTDTNDAEGKVVFRKNVGEFSVELIQETLNKFRGNIQQIPPMFSAIKKDGKRLYRLARKGVTVPREPRQVHVYEIDLLSWENPRLTIQVTCSKGTYIRALARDIGQHLQTGAFLKTLRRTRIGPYRIEDTCSLEDIREICTVDESLSVQS